MSQPSEQHPVGDLYTAMTGAGHGHDEQPVGPPQAAVLGVGHEPDAFNVKPILNVPVFITIVMVMAFAITSGFFGYFGAFSKPKETPINDQLAKISSTDEKAAVNQPRLEGMYRWDSTRDGKVDDAYFRSVRPSEDGNSPMIRPEDLRPDNYVDPITKQKVLRDYAWVNKEKGIVRLPISVAMKTLLAKNAFAVQANVSAPTYGTKTMPKLSNGGNELPVSAAVDPKVVEKVTKPHDEKKDH